MIRTARESDIPGILAIYNEAILHTTAVYDYQEHSLVERKAWFEEKKQADFPVLVFEIDSQVAGFAALGSFRPWPAYKYTTEHAIYVHADYRRRGIAKQLLQELIRLAGEKEYATMVAGIDSENIGSINLHKQMGFEDAGLVKRAGFKFGRWLDLVFLQLQLPGPQCPVEK